MKKFFTQLLASAIIFLISFTNPNFSSAQFTVVIPGNFQSELGCSGDWQPDCNNTRLTFNGVSGFWEGTFLIPAGNWEFKVAHDNSWAVNYGAGGVLGGANIPLALGSHTNVTFKYSAITHIVSVSFSGIATVVIPGSFQSEVGCSGDWQPDCDNTRLSFDALSGLWYGIFAIPQGNYEFKVTHDNSWAENYGAGGVLNGPNIPLNIADIKKRLFRYNPNSHIVTVNSVDLSVIIAGNFQSELGCTGDWQPDCANTGLSFDAPNNLWSGEFIIPAGNWEFKIAIDGSWNENYGVDGILNGANIALNLPLTSKVKFVYNPLTHITTVSVQSVTVVLPGTFQSELGCTPVTYINGDWEPGCDFTRLTYDAGSGLFTGTFNIPAGYWEYKVAINNSWNENYGLGGLPNGDNIPLDLPVASAITFKYNPVTHIVTLEFVTTGVCVNKFYDANVNGYQDYGELSMGDINFTVFNSGYTSSKTTGSDGKVCFEGLNTGVYSVKETVPPNNYPTTFDSQVVVLGEPKTLQFGNVCLGAGGAQGIGYWANKNGQEKMNMMGMENTLWWLRYMNLRNADGSHFDPVTYIQFKNWLQSANAKNMAYMLSAQMAAMFLNIQAGYVNYNAIVYTPGCGTLGAKYNFMYAGWLVWNTNYYLMFFNNAVGNDPNRPYLECYKNGLSDANSNLNFVQLQPCSIAAPLERRPAQQQTIVSPETETKVWPNPSSSYFTLRPTNSTANATVQLRVFDINGKQVYATNGSVNKNYQFGQNFAPGLYLAEVIRGTNRETFKLIKQ